MSSMADADFKVKLVNVYLNIHKVKVHSSVSMANKMVQSFIISAGNPQCRKAVFLADLFQGLLCLA